MWKTSELRTGLEGALLLSTANVPTYEQCTTILRLFLYPYTMQCPRKAREPFVVFQTGSGIQYGQRRALTALDGFCLRLLTLDSERPFLLSPWLTIAARDALSDKLYTETGARHLHGLGRASTGPDCFLRATFS